jgi:predicted solute-binding protein
VHRPIRLGCVQYLNARPLIQGWRGEVRFDHPSRLCEALAAGELDAALVSSFEYLRHPVYVVVDGVAIASDGPVYSVFVAHLNRTEELREIVIDPASATSVNLLRCLLGERRLQPRLVSDGEITPTRGRLLIGDQAIRFRQTADAGYQFLDLGAAWKDATGLPFVYALWLIRSDLPEKSNLAQALRSLGQNNREHLGAVIAAQAETDRAFSEFYFRDCLRFRFDEREKQGFQRFAELCVRHRLLAELPPAPELV